MANVPSSAAQAKHQARQAGHEAAPWVEKLARIGYAAKGVVYIVVGGLAVQTAFGSGGRITGSEGALQTIGSQPLGQILLGLVALGLVGYAVWRLVAAVLDPENKGTDAKGIITRIGFLVSAVIHGALALEAFRLLRGSAGGGGGDSGAQQRTATLMSQPFGVWLVGAVGLIVLGFGLYELYKAYTVDLSKRLDLSKMDADHRRWVIRIGRFGFAARGVVFALIGIFLIQAALQHDPSESRGLEGALESLLTQPFGPWLLALVALGLVGYGVFTLVKSRYRRIDAG